MIRFASLAAVLAVAHSVAAQTVTFTVTYNDPGSVHAAYYPAMTANIQAAGALWAQKIQPSANTNIEVGVIFGTTYPRMNGGSTATGYVRTTNNINIYEQGMAYELRTGVDPNGSATDFNLYPNPTYFTQELWLDPNPVARTAPVPLNRTDAVSVILHEMGHGLAFNGWRDYTTAALPSNYQSTFDEYVTSSGGVNYFNGPEAMALYGGPVPLTSQNLFHFGNDPNAVPALPGGNLVPDLMNGVVFYRGTRYNISDLDVAVLKDVGVPLAPVPEPTGLIAVAVFVGWGVRRIR
jgi:hypothetical protein